jgi:site-specific DNA-methyltransferase (adenine-specific)
MDIEPYYQDDHVTIWHGDCLELADVWIDADVLVTDPPYGIAWTKGHNKAAHSRRHDGIQNDQDASYRDAVVRLMADKPGAVFGSLYAPFPPALRQVLIWEKPKDAGVFGSTTGFRRDVEAVFLVGEWPHVNCRSGSVLRSVIPNIGSPSSPAGQTGHPHAKPTDLVVKLIDSMPGGLIVDPFMGSGTTLRAAKDLGRKAIGIEIEERYCEIAAKRLAQEVLDFGPSC